jgi:hypothetical protein
MQPLALLCLGSANYTMACPHCPLLSIIFFKLLLIFCIVGNFLQNCKINKFTVFYAFLQCTKIYAIFCTALQ